MPLRLDIKRRLTARSDRVKSVDLHPTEPWMVVSLYSGTVVVWNHDTQTMVKTFELCELPVRVAKFVARKHWIIAGADDMQIRVFNYNTLERVHMFEAHADYIRCIAVHPTQPYILTSSDDMLIKLWDWDRKWACSQVFEGHTHYVMQIVINPKDNNQFASASLDRTIKVWQLGSKTPNFTLEGHEKGVNCIDYYSGGDKPYLISGADDRLVKIWDYQNKTCVQTLEGHAQNVTCVSFHPELPIILTGSEDGTVRVWHSNTYRLENTLNYGMERVWCICGQPGSNSVALGYDEGSIIIKLGREEPAMSMDSSGKVMWARHSEVQQANLKAMGEAEIRDGERLPLGVKDMGSCEIYPQTIQHSPNGRFVVVCGDGEYIIYTAMALRNKSFGSAQEFVWAHDSSQYAIREGNSMVKIFKNFKEKKAFKPDFGAEGIFGGFLLGVRSNSGLAFYDWESATLVRRIDIQPKHILWSDSGELVCIATDESFFVLHYLPEKASAALESNEEMSEDGIEDAFEVLGEVQEVVRTGVWVGDCFIYTSSVNRLNYYVGGEIITIAHMDRTMYLLGYIPKDDRLYLGDKELNIISYSLLLSVLEYQTAVMRRDFSTADKVLPTIPKEQRTRVAHFLEKQGFRQQALAVSTDPEHKFELALQLGELKIAYQLASEAESEQKWKQLAELATTKCQFSLAQECLHQAQDYGGLLLLATASGNTDMVGKLAEGAERDGKTNVAFLTYFLQGRLDKCLDLLIKTDRLPEAAFLARTYLPSHVSRVVKLWKESLSKVNQKAADALADPTQYSNLFPGLQQALLAEQYLKETHVRVRPAAEYLLIMPNEDRNVLEESAGFVSSEEVREPEEVMESRNESFTVEAATEPGHPEATVMEEPIPLKQKMSDPVSSAEEESSPTAASPLPITVTEDHVELKQAEFASSEVVAFEPDVVAIKEDTTTKLEEASVSVEEESTIEISPKEPEMLQSGPVEEIISSVEEDVQEMSPTADAVPAACDSETCLVETAIETIIVTEEAPSETMATKAIATQDILVTTALTVDADAIAPESAAAWEMPVYDELETDVISSDAPPPVDTDTAAAEGTPVTKEVVLESAPSAVAVEELISFENTNSSVLDVPVQVQASPEFVLDPLLDPLEDTMPVLKPDPAQEPEQKGQSAALPVKPEDNLEPHVPLKAEPEVLSPAATPTEGNIVEEETGAKGTEEPAEDLGVEMNEEVLDDLDLDNFDLEDVDTTDVNLDEDFLNE
ncbi:coatomer subunit beta' [Lates calcarifer]|uniref:Coatomer subunit beta' n=1 Tax=Lates calcarifer TaxID=8187 RepID=A0A4W6C5K0_LATCA|nr:coatomer subunit beta' [Lates calcarifer]